MCVRGILCDTALHDVAVAELLAEVEKSLFLCTRKSRITRFLSTKDAQLCKVIEGKVALTFHHFLIML